MIEERTISATSDAKLINFVSTALRQDKLSGLSEMLRAIAEAVDAYGCVLWQVAPGSNLEANPAQGSLFVSAQWLRDESYIALYNLSLESISGRALRTKTPINVPDILGEPPNLTSFLETTRIRTMCSVPITFVDGIRGTVNLYRNVSQPFTEKEVRTLEQLASLVPALHQTIRDKVSLKLISSIDEIINAAELRSKDRPLSLSHTKSVFAAMCARIATTFDCIEASLFLRSNPETPKEYELMATTWPGPFKKTSYRSSTAEGITGWVLVKRRPVKIFDLANFDRDRIEINKTYPNLRWQDSLEIKSTAHGMLGLPKNTDLPPLSFMAVPIVVGTDVLGAIRCSTSKGPYYFSDRELDLLTLVAAQVGRYASNWLGRLKIQQENESWRALVRGVSRLNRFVQAELTRDMPNELRILNEALKLTSNVIHGAEIMDVRLFDARTNELYFAATHGAAWNQGTESEIEERKRRRFRVLEEPGSAGAHVFKTAQLYVVKDAETDPYYSKTFPSIKQMIVAPMSVEPERFGVLDIRANAGSEFSTHAEAVAELLGQQIGLYYYLAKVMQRLRQAETELKDHVSALKKLQNQQAQTFEDLEHQFKSPIVQAYARIESVLKEAPDDRLRGKLLAIRGLCGKAKRVTMSTGLFAQLAQGKRIEPHLKPLHYDDLVKLTIQAAADAQLIMDPSRRIHFHVDRNSPDVFRTIQVKVDYDLLEQSLNNLLDNASKYSFEGSSVEILWGLTGTERFHISICNIGIPFPAKDVFSAKERGWRGEFARSVTGEGSGIGLWIVDHIMRAHGGELLVNATNKRGLTQVRLVFPGKSLW